MFGAALFLIPKIWTQKRCTSVGEWTNKLWYTQTMLFKDYFKNKLPSCEKKKYVGCLHAYY